MEPFILYAVLVVFASIGSISLLFKSETIRGIGRISLGISLVLVAAMDFWNNAGKADEIEIYFTIAMAVAGLITILSGARKHSRAKVEPSAKPQDQTKK